MEIRLRSISKSVRRARLVGLEGILYYQGDASLPPLQVVLETRRTKKDLWTPVEVISE